MMNSFGNPEFLWLLLLVPVLIAVYIRRIKKKTGSISFPDISIIKKANNSPLLFLMHILPVLRVFAVIMIILALARPRDKTVEKEVLRHGVDIILALDISISMAMQDFRPDNRLQVAKNVIADFIKKRQNDRIGLVVFSGMSFTKCPLTFDYGILERLVKETDFFDIDSDGTAIGSAIAAASNRLRHSRAKSRVIILLTDGANNAGPVDPITAARAAASLGIKIYTIGIGKEGRHFASINHPRHGKQSGYLASQLDEESLEEIASITSAKFFRAKSGGRLREIYDEIDRLEKSRIETKTFEQYTELMGGFLLAAFIALVAEVLLRETRFRRIP
ncbi:MAG: vWA domain-containing protein [Fibrobacterota bacterium]